MTAPARIPAAGDPASRKRELVQALDEEFLGLVDWSWDLRVVTFPKEHPVLGVPDCPVPGCVRGRTGGVVCDACAVRRAGLGIPLDEFVRLPSPGNRVVGQLICEVPGCPRPRTCPGWRLCATHHDQRVKRLVDYNAARYRAYVAEERQVYLARIAYDRLLGYDRAQTQLHRAGLNLNANGVRGACGAACYEKLLGFTGGIKIDWSNFIGVMPGPGAAGDGQDQYSLLGHWATGTAPAMVEISGNSNFVAQLRTDATMTNLRSAIAMEIASGGAGPGAHGDFQYADRGSDPGHWYSSILGASEDLLGAYTNGRIGNNPADSFLGTYSGSWRINSYNAKRGMINASFHVYNTTDLHSLTHLRQMPEPQAGWPMGSFNENLDWTEQWNVWGSPVMTQG